MDACVPRSRSPIVLLGFVMAVATVGCERADRPPPEGFRAENLALRSAVEQLEQRQRLLKSVFGHAEPGIWNIAWEGEGATRPRLVLAKGVSAEAATPQNLVRELDRSFAPGVMFVAVKDATVYLRIRDAALLTQRSGSFGAAAHLAQLTFSMTSLEGIQRIHVDMPEGDHAAPGFYSRADFLGHLGLLQ